MVSRDTIIMTGDVGKLHRDLFSRSILAAILPFEKVSSKLPTYLLPCESHQKDDCTR